MNQANAALAVLADPPVHHVDGAVMDYLLIEAVNALRASSAVATARAKRIEREMVEAGLLPAPAPAKAQQNRDSVESSSKQRVSGDDGGDDEDEDVRIRLEAIGRHVGASFAERLCRDRALFSDALDAIKFVCKEVWVACWDKQVDNLRTNHRGVFVLQDHVFKPLARISSWESRARAARRAKLHAAFPAGLIRGTLARIGLPGTVTPETSSLPHCTFQVKLPKNA